MINKEKSLLKQLLPHVIAIITFLAITMVYFSPLLDGKELSQNDVNHFRGMAKEIRDYYYDEGKTSAWSGSSFSGMPAYQIGVYGGSPNFLDYLEKPYKALGNNTAGPVFAGMLMAYILFCLMGFSPVVSIFGAIAYSLSSYNLIILEAGHVTKAWALAYLPLIVAGIMALFKDKILLAGLLVSLGLALQIKNNHLQMTYYTGIFCAILFIAYAIEKITKKDIKSLLKASGVMILALVLAVASNMGNIYANMEMARESIRGKSELSTLSTSEKQSSGLDKDYAFAWSYGKAETLSFLIPDIHGGASGGTLGRSSNLAKEMVKQGYGAQVSPQGIQSYTYWGDQPFTQGPVYFGAIVCFLFLLGMIVIRNKMKWWIFGATIFFIFLSWGRNMEWFNDFFFYHFPLYNKFRAVSSSLVIPALTVVMIAAWGIKEFFSGDIDKERLKKALYISAGVTGGLCLFFWMAPGFFFNFTAEGDAAWRSQMPDWYYNTLIADRKDLLSSDAARSLIFVLLAGAALFISLQIKAERTKLSVFVPLSLALLVLIDLWGIDKRYLNDSNFVAKDIYTSKVFPKTKADESILLDKHPSYRVLNLNNPFQESNTSFYHKSIGGYHAAKLKRYNELIEHRLAEEVGFVQQQANKRLQEEVARLQNAPVTEGVNPQELLIKAVQDSLAPIFSSTPILNMLNTKYIIFHPELPALKNGNALGNAWFVQQYRFVDNADQEMEAVKTQFDPLHTLVVDKRFENELTGLTIVPDSVATIELTGYKPDILTYKSNANSEQLAVFSEIYFSNGWHAYIDGQKALHFRADWTLMAMRVPAGSHEIVFKFEPEDYFLSRTVATASSLVLIIMILAMCGYYFVKKEKKA